MGKTLKSLIWKTVLMAVVSVLAAAPVGARMKIGTPDRKDFRASMSAGQPVHCLAIHNIGKIALAVANNGTFGNNYHPGPSQDWFTGEDIPYSCQYPKNSSVQYLFGGAFWIGAVVGRDTLVSVGADGWQWVYEMYPDEAPFGEMVYRSIRDPNAPEFEGAVSEEDYISVYTDTFTEGIPNDYFGRPHMPLNIEVTEASYAWSYAYAEDFVLFDYQIRNIGTEILHDVYMGVYVDCMICFDCFGTNLGYTDDHSGFLHTWPSTYGSCEYLDTVNIAWIADDDGDLDVIYDDGQLHPAPNVTATRIVRTPAESLAVSFNWWIGNGNASLDFAPRKKADFRDFQTGGLGTPEGDVNKYYVLRNGEFDYNQVYTASIQPNDPVWLYPNQELAANFADGYDTRYLLSFGPFEVRPGQTLPISFAYVAGENLHVAPGNSAANLPDRPDQYLDNLDFTDLALNATWASWVYDNPGVDTDGDGFSGKFRTCCEDSAIDAIDTVSEDPLITDTTWIYDICDTFFYEGDGVPDFRGASPPPAPEFRLEPSVGAIRVRFNGLRSETTRDVFSNEIDFEGYRIYLGRDERASSYSVVASLDIEDYNKYVWDEDLPPDGGWGLFETPFTIEELRCLYGDSCGDEGFQPLHWTRTRPYIPDGFPDSMFFFEAQDYNASVPGVSTPIVKVYPDQPWPSHLDPDSARPDELTEDGYLRYFEYEFIIEDLLPTVPFWVNVTAFDYGSPESGLASLETSVTVGAKYTYPQSGWDEVQNENLDVIVYPNPYLLSGEYRDLGYEGRTDPDRPPERTRLVHFANVPPECTIRIYTLDGDLVREINHSDGTTHETWNLITRNTQAVVSGLYYWTVEAPGRETQIGKLAVIM